VVLKYRCRLGKSRFIIMMAYTVIPLTAVTLQLTAYGIPVLSVGFLVFTVLIFTGIQSQQAKRIKEQELENQEQRITLMLSQIQPHFLFNALLSIKHLCKTDPDAAGESVDHFARYLRRNLEALESRKPVPFSEELEHVKTYLFLEKKRYKDLLNVEFDIQSASFCLPALTVQPLVENAVRHGISKKETGGTVRISARETEEAYEITIADDGVGFEPGMPSGDWKTHVGIENVRQRLAMQCGGTLSYNSRIGQGTIVTILIKK
jgi:LytS/YehU family sensor histidine kinase